MVPLSLSPPRSSSSLPFLWLGIVWLFALASPTWAAVPAACTVRDPLRVVYLVDNSGSLAGDPVFKQQSAVWLERFVLALRPGDEIRAYRLQAHAEDTLHTAGAPFQLPADPASRATSAAAWVRRVTDELTRRENHAPRSDIAAALIASQASLLQRSATGCPAVLLLASDGSLDPFAPLHPDQALDDLRTRVAEIRKQEIPVFAVAFRSEGKPAFDRGFRLRWAPGVSPLAHRERWQGMDVLVHAFDSTSVIDGSRADGAFEILLRAPGAAFRARGLQWGNSPRPERLVKANVKHLVYRVDWPGGRAACTAGGGPSDDHIVTGGGRGSDACYHFVFDPPDSALLHLARQIPGDYGWAGDDGLDASSIPDPVMHAQQIIVSSMPRGQSRGECSSQTLRRRLRDHVRPRPQSGIRIRVDLENGQYRDTLTLDEVGGTNCFAPVAGRILDPANFDPAADLLLDIQLQENGITVRRVIDRRKVWLLSLEWDEFSSFRRFPVLPFWSQVWAVSGRIPLPDGTIPEMELGDSILPLALMGSTGCKHRARGTGCYGVDRLYVGNQAPTRAEIYFPQHPNQPECSPRSQRCGWITMPNPKALPQGSLYLPWYLIVSFFVVIAAAITLAGPFRQVVPGHNEGLLHYVRTKSLHEWGDAVRYAGFITLILVATLDSILWWRERPPSLLTWTEISGMFTFWISTVAVGWLCKWSLGLPFKKSPPAAT